MSSQDDRTAGREAAGPRCTTLRLSGAGQGTDRGSATVLAIGVIGGLTAVLVAALVLVSVLVAGQQARAAADLAALAAAGEVVLGVGREQACAEAAAVAGQNGARLQSCELRHHAGQPWPRVLVSVRREVASTPWSVTARATAGGSPVGVDPAVGAGPLVPTGPGQDRLLAGVGVVGAGLGGAGLG